MPSSKIHRPQPIKSWTEKSTKAYGKEGGAVPSPRGLYNKGRTAIPVNATVGGEWELQACEELTAWANGILKRHKQRQITDLKKGLADGITLVNLLQVLFNDVIDGAQSRPIIRAQRMENIHLCLRFLQTRGIDMQGIDSQDIADGSLRVGLLLMTRLQGRFENKNTTTGSSHRTNGSFHKGHGMDPLNNNGFRPLSRGASVHSNISGSSNNGVLPDLGNSYDSSSHKQFMRPNPIMEKPETLLPGGAVGSDGEGTEMTPPKLNDIVSRTELDSGGVLQHKWADSQQKQGEDVSLDIEMANMFLMAEETEDPGPANFTSNGPGVQSSVEERLKSLLEMPNPGGYNEVGDVQDEGEVLELPPPDMDAVAEGDDSLDDEERLQAILEDPDNFEDFPQDWDRYISDYVPSHAMEKKEGPRAEVMMEKASSSPHQFQEPFFHGPPREHLGPCQGQTSQGQPVPDYGIRSRSEPLPRYLNQAGNMAGVVYSEQESYHSHSGQEGPPPNRGSHNGRHLPTYQDHLQSRSGVRSLASSSSGYDSRGHLSPGSAFQGPGTQSMHHLSSPYQNKPEALQQQYYDNGRREGQHELHGRGIIHANSTYPGYTSAERQNQPQWAGEYSSHDVSPIDNPFPVQAPPSHFSQPPSWARGKAGDPPDQRWSDSHAAKIRSSSMHHNHPPPSSSSNYNHHPPWPERRPEVSPPSSKYSHHPPWPERRPEESPDFPRDHNHYSGSTSSRTDTPSLPAMSPPESPPATPPMNLRSSSADPGGVGLSLRGSRKSRGRRSPEKSRKSPEKVKPPFNRSTSEPKITVRRMSGRRKNTRRSPESKQSLRALPYLPLHRVKERSEDSETSASYSRADRHHPRKDDPSRREVTTPPLSTSRDDEIAALRGQLLSLENMYKEMQKSVGAGGDGSAKTTPRSARKPRNVKANVANKTTSKFKVNSKLTAKQRERDVKAINKRFSRVESHVVTLARSVGSLSTQLRSQSSLIEEIEEIRRDLEQLRNIQLTQSLPPFRPTTVPLAANPVSVKKLTKFFGEEPPLLTLFLTELGYDKYVSLFEEAEIGLQELPYLTEERLEQLGIPMGPRARIIQEAQLMV